MIDNIADLAYFIGLALVVFDMFLMLIGVILFAFELL